MKNWKSSLAILPLLSIFFWSCDDEAEVAKTSPPSQPTKNGEVPPPTPPESDPEPNVIRAGALEISPASQYKKAKVGTTEVEFTYTAVNLGFEPVTITRVDSGCACIEESVSPRVIPPGESSRISAIYTTEKLNGLAEKILTISTDQPNVRDAALIVKLEMEPIYVIDQELTTWDKGKKPERKTVTFEVTREEPIHVLSAKSSRSEITAELEEVEKGRTYRIHLTPSSTGANLLGMVRLTTDCEIEAHARPLLYVTVQ